LDLSTTELVSLRKVASDVVEIPEAAEQLESVSTFSKQEKLQVGEQTEMKANEQSFETNNLFMGERRLESVKKEFLEDLPPSYDISNPIQMKSIGFVDEFKEQPIQGISCLDML
jgi:hypothetical protein